MLLSWGKGRWGDVGEEVRGPRVGVKNFSSAQFPLQFREYDHLFEFLPLKCDQIKTPDIVKHDHSVETSADINRRPIQHTPVAAAAFWAAMRSWWPTGLILPTVVVEVIIGNIVQTERLWWISAAPSPTDHIEGIAKRDPLMSVTRWRRVLALNEIPFARRKVKSEEVGMKFMACCSWEDIQVLFWWEDHALAISSQANCVHLILTRYLDPVFILQHADVKLGAVALPKRDTRTAKHNQVSPVQQHTTRSYFSGERSSSLKLFPAFRDDVETPQFSKQTAVVKRGVAAEHVNVAIVWHTSMAASWLRNRWRLCKTDHNDVHVFILCPKARLSPGRVDSLGPVLFNAIQIKNGGGFDRRRQGNLGSDSTGWLLFAQSWYVLCVLYGE